MMERQEKIKLPQINYLDMGQYDFKKAKGKVWIRYREDLGGNYHTMYPDLHDEDLLLVDFNDQDLHKGYLFLLYLPDHKKYPFVVRQVRKYVSDMIQITEAYHNHFPPDLLDLSKQPNPILGRVLYSIRKLDYKG